MLMQAEMSQEERVRFCERWIRMADGFESLDRSSQAKVMDLAAKLHWQKMSKMQLNRLMVLKILCRILDEQDELKIAELIEKKTARGESDGGKTKLH